MQVDQDPSADRMDTDQGNDAVSTQRTKTEDAMDMDESDVQSQKMGAFSALFETMTQQSEKEASLPGTPNMELTTSPRTARGSTSSLSVSTNVRKPAWEHLDEITAILKTAHPLLSLTMETLVDQVRQNHFSLIVADFDAHQAEPG